MIKHIEIKTYEYYDIRVMVRIDYEAKTISLIERMGAVYTPNCNGGLNEKSFKPKPYVFVGRGLEYMNGWRNVLSAMEYAITEAEKELTEYLKQKEKEKHDLVTDVLMKATDLVNQKRYGKKRKR